MSVALERSPFAATRSATATEDTPHRTTVTVGEVVVLGSICLVLLVGSLALALGHVGALTLPAVLGPTVVLGVAGALLLARSPVRPRVVVDRREAALLLGLGLLAGFMFFPGFPYGGGDKDPGVYVEHAQYMSRTGDLLINDPVLDKSVVPAFQPSSPNARFAGLWVLPGGYVEHEVQPGFYHFYSSVLASAHLVGGDTALFNVNPLLALLSVLGLALLARRMAGWVAAAVVGVLLATNMLEVWQAKYPSTEVLSQLMLIGALLAVVVALQARWRTAAAVAGALTAACWLVHPAGILVVLGAVGVGCALVVLRRFDLRCTAFAAGFGIVAAYGAWQAYGPARRYTVITGGLTESRLVLLLTVAGLLAVAGAVLLRGRGAAVAARLGDRRWQLAMGMGVLGVAAALIVVGFLRPRLFGPHYTLYQNVRIRDYDEQALRRLSWFVTLPGFALMWVGLAVVALRRWSGAVWAAVLPVCVLLPLYAWKPKNSPQLMWWPRRFVPAVLFGMLLLIALGIAWTATRKGRSGIPLKVAAGVSTLFLVGSFLQDSLPLRGHREYAGTRQVARDVAALAGDAQGVFLWSRKGTSQYRPGVHAPPVWLAEGQVSVLLPLPATEGYVLSFRRGFPGQPVFVVGAGPEPPEGLEGLPLRQVSEVRSTMEVWNESVVALPTSGGPRPVSFTVWRLAGT